MSRKNHNASHRQSKRKTYPADYLKPTPLEIAIAKANQGTRATQDECSVIRCDERCSYMHRLLPVELLETDVSYQRKVDVKRVQEIVDNYDPRLVNSLKVSNRDGKFYIFDGSHTLAALKQIHKGEHFVVDCKVFSGLTYEDEAYLFALQTGESKDVAFRARLRAMLISNSEEAVMFKKHTAAAGFTLAEETSSNSRYTIAALAKSYKIFTEYGPERYEAILKLLASTFDGAGWSVTSYLLGGMAVFFREFGDEIKVERFVKRLRGVTYDAIRDEARRQMRKSTDIAHALAFAKFYNAGGGRGSLDVRKLTMLD